MKNAIVVLLLLAGCALDSSPIEGNGMQCWDLPANRDERCGWVGVSGPGAWCGGSMVGDDTVVTAAHCIPDEQDVSVNDTKRHVPVIAIDRERDYAFLRLPARPPGREPYEMAPALPEKGDVLRLVGRGCNGNLEVRELKSIGDVWARGCVCKGDSGSPVLDGQGRLVGFMRAYLQDDPQAVEFVDVTGMELP